MLLVGGAGEDERTAFFGPDPTMVGNRRHDLAAFGVDDPLEAALVDVAVRAALTTDAAVCVLPDAALLNGRLGALLRWS